MDIADTLDATGLFCPEPVMLLHNAIPEIAVGECLKVIATDPSTQRDVPRFCQFLGHDLVSEEEKEGTYVYVIRRQQ